MKLTHLSLFSGIGGFDLASEWMGWENIAHCEINEFCLKILKYYWPNAKTHTDIKTTDFTIYRGKVNVLTGGFPCQPYSLAGLRKGKEDERHLWPHMLRAIREIQPEWVVGENVFGIVNWNNGLVFEEVQADLEAAGYEVQSYILPACGVDAPHKRERVWFVAHKNSNKNGRGGKQWEKEPGERKQWNISTGDNEWICPYNGKLRISSDTNCGSGLPLCRYEGSSWRKEEEHPINSYYGSYGNATNTISKGLQRGNRTREAIRFKSGNKKDYWSKFPTQPPICNGNDGVSANAHFRTFRNENTMDRSLVIKSALEAGRLVVDFETGKIFSTRQRGKEGEQLELTGADCNGYIVHNISFNGIKKQCRAHQIVWIAANGLYDKEILMIDHINRNRKDNRLSNLRLVDAQGNRDNATPYEGKLTQEQKDMVWFMNKESHMSMREIAEIVGISKSRVQQIVSEHEGLDGITFSKWRNESIKGGGNAIVPQVAHNIFKSIEAFYNL